MESIKEFLDNDHKRLDALFRETHKFPIIFREFNKGLMQHMRWEEELLFPLLEKKHHDELAFLKYEHKKIKYLLCLINERVGKNLVLGELGEELGHVLMHHNHREENNLYAWLDDEVNNHEAVLEKMRASALRAR